MTEFQCPYADKGESRCPPWRCDCFIEQYPDDPFGLHPEAFTVMVACPTCGHVGLIGGNVCPVCSESEP